MQPMLGASREIRVGVPTVIEAASPDGRFAVVFEDDGDTGYFYARDLTLPDSLFEDALHIYSVKGVTDVRLPSMVQILWSPDGSKACLLINRYPHALFDFAGQRGYSRDMFPEPSPDSRWTHEAWDDSLRRHFFDDEHDA